MREVIIACDFKNKEELYTLLDALKNEKPYLKIGMQLYYQEGAPLIRALKEKEYKIFLDLKLHDIPNTVYSAMKVIANLDVDIVNVHVAGGIEMMKKAKAALVESNAKTKLFGVTILTSLDEQTLHDELRIPSSLKETVKQYAMHIKEAGLDGVICSPYEAPMMKEIGLLSLTPGIRFETDDHQDQVRVATPEKAKTLGSDYIVVGRSITKADNPLAAYRYAKEEFCS